MLILEYVHLTTLQISEQQGFLFISHIHNMRWLTILRHFELLLRQVPTKGSKINLGVEGYPSLSHSTFLIWYRVLVSRLEYFEVHLLSKFILQFDVLRKCTLLQRFHPCSSVIY